MWEQLDQPPIYSEVDVAKQSLDSLQHANLEDASFNGSGNP